MRTLEIIEQVRHEWASRPSHLETGSTARHVRVLWKTVQRITKGMQEVGKIGRRRGESTHRTRMVPSSPRRG